MFWPDFTLSKTFFCSPGPAYSFVLWFVFTFSALATPKVPSTTKRIRALTRMAFIIVQAACRIQWGEITLFS